MATENKEMLQWGDTAANLASVVPLARQLVWSTDTKILKMGDGSTTWGALPAISAGPAGPAYVPSASGIYTPPPGSGCGPETTWGLDGANPSPYWHYYGPTWLAEADFRITAARVVVTAALASNDLRLGLVEMSSGDQPTALAGDWGTVSAASTGDKDITGLTTDVAAGTWYATVLVRYGGGGTVSVRAWPVPYGHMGQDSGVPNRIVLGRKVQSSSSGPSTGLSNPPSNWSTLVGAAGNGTPGPLEFIFVKRAAL